MKVFLVFSLTILATVYCRPPNFAPGRSGIVHLFEWRWLDVAAECERWLGPRGFGAVQISPPNENIVIPGRPWWERYQPVSYIINTRSGTEFEFQMMTARCNAVGVRVYADIVINHMTGDHDRIFGTALSKANTVTRSFPSVPYTADDFNPRCSIDDWNDVYQVRNCELFGLHDLDQSSPVVRDRIVGYLNHLIDLGVTGFRVDAVRHMWPQDLAYMYGHVKDLPATEFMDDPRPWFFQEVWNDNVGAPGAWYYIHLAPVTEFNYGEFLARHFRGEEDLAWLISFGPAWNMLPSDDAVVFVDNHDTQRRGLLNYQEKRAYIMAEAFSLAWNYGFVKVMSSYHFTDFDQGPPADSAGNILPVTINSDGSCGNGWVCEHRWNAISNMIEFQTVVAGTDMTNWWPNASANQIAFSRGNRGFVAFNTASYDLHASIQTGMAPGVYCDVISGARLANSCTGEMITVNADGMADIHVSATGDLGVVAIHVNSRL